MNLASSMKSGQSPYPVLPFKEHPQMLKQRSKGEPSSPPFTRLGKMVMYSVRELERYMEDRTVEGRYKKGGNTLPTEKPN
jgi:hypothetical protein